MIQQLVDLRRQQEGGTSLVLQLWLAELLNSGAVDRHLRRIRVHHRKKRNLIADYLRRNFPDWQWQMPKVIQQWLDRGVQIFSGVDYCDRQSKESENYLILGFGGVTKEQIHQAFTQLI